MAAYMIPSLMSKKKKRRRIRLSLLQGKECDTYEKLYWIPMTKRTERTRTWRVGFHFQSTKPGHPSGFDAGIRLWFLTRGAIQLRPRQSMVPVAQIASQNLVRVTLMVKTPILRMTATRRWIINI
jgi:hypothetical protein